MKVTVESLAADAANHKAYLARLAPHYLKPHLFNSDHGTAANYARTLGAVCRKNRYGVGGVLCGYDYINADGRIVLESMTGVK